MGQPQGLGDRHLPTLCGASTLCSSFVWAGVVLTQGDVHNAPATDEPTREKMLSHIPTSNLHVPGYPHMPGCGSQHSILTLPWEGVAICGELPG